MLFSFILGLVNSMRHTYTGENDIENCGREERDKEDIKQRGGGGGGLAPWRWVVLWPSWKVSPRLRVPSAFGLFTGWLGTVCLSSSSAAAKSLQSCPTVRPHRRQHTRLPGPWDSPGKNTGVGCHFLLQCMKVKSESEVAQLCPTLFDPVDCSPPGFSVHGIPQARVLEWGAIANSSAAAAAAKSLQSCPTLCDPMDCSPPGSSIHGIFQARVLEWGAIAFSNQQL